MDAVVQIALQPLDLDLFFLGIKDTKSGTYIVIQKCKAIRQSDPLALTSIQALN